MSHLRGHTLCMEIPPVALYHITKTTHPENFRRTSKPSDNTEYYLDKKNTFSFQHTVDGSNPAPPGIYTTLLNMRYSPYQLVQDFSHQQYLNDFVGRPGWFELSGQLLGFEAPDGCSGKLKSFMEFDCSPFSLL